MSNAVNGGMLVPEATQMETFTGRFVDTLHPDPAALLPEDIAHHLSLLCRYGGAISRFYSVAEHAVLVHDLVAHMGEMQLGVLRAALLHDAAEAYLGDVISPLKYAMRSAEFDSADSIPRAGCLDHHRGTYSQLTQRMDRAIAMRFGVGPVEIFDYKPIKVADMWALRIEARALTRSRGENWRWPGELPEGGELPESITWSGGLTPEAAEARFSHRLGKLDLFPFRESVQTCPECGGPAPADGRCESCRGLSMVEAGDRV